MNDSQQARIIELTVESTATSLVSAPVQIDSVLACRPVMQLWALRMITRGARPEHCLARGGPALEALLDFPARPAFDLKVNDEAERLKEMSRKVEKDLVEAEKEGRVLSGPLAENLALLAQAAGLSDTDREILAAAMLGRQDEGLQAAFDAVSQRYADTSLARVLAHAFGRSFEEVASALEPRSALGRAGLVFTDSGADLFLNKLKLFAGMTRAFAQPADSVDELLGFALRRPVPPTLTVEDFAHLRESVELLLAHFRSSALEGSKGVNALLFGPPGVGKTELARLIAREAGLLAVEVAAADQRDWALSRFERIRALTLAQRVLAAKRGALVIFDEIEDAFSAVGTNRNMFSEWSPTASKAWTNALLEENPVPTIWIANRVAQLDPAYLRRFDVIFEVTPPTRRFRAELIRESLRDAPVEPEWVQAHAENPHLTPALIERIGKVVRTGGSTESKTVARQFDLLARGALAAQGVVTQGRYATPARYRPEWTNTNVDLEGVCGGLRARGRGRLLLYGPPGTGKTAYAHHLARELDRPLLVRRTSDLLSKWVGETEKNLARAFQEAGEEGAVLLLDEADSFLQDRQWAVRSWEVSHVNELLAQIECFEGVLVCATNSLERFDSASLRRFALKIEFQFLTVKKRAALFEALVVQLLKRSLTEGEQENARMVLGELVNLTPGDFTAVRQRWEIEPGTKGTAELLEAIREESRLKPDGKKTVIGFT
jgi:transitional endoplasmic reticulum ATPase